MASQRVMTVRDVPFGSDPREALDIYHPDTPGAGRPVLVFFYGGGWRSGDKADYAFLGQTMAKRGIVTVIANYRLYPQVTFPAFLSDAADAAGWAVRHASEYGGDPHRVYLMGYSTGAYMAAMLTLDRQYLARDGLAPTDYAGMIGLAGPYDFSQISKEYAALFPDGNSPRANPVDQVTGQPPPMLLLSGSNDDVVPVQNTSLLAARVNAAGGRATVITYPGVGHIGIMLPFSAVSHSNAAIVDDVTAFLKSKGGNAP